jgi:hypothetical protein
MRSSYNSNYSSSSSSLQNSNYSSPSHSLDIGLTPFTGSDRAEFHDRYQNKVRRKKKQAILLMCIIDMIVCLA